MIVIYIIGGIVCIVLCYFWIKSVNVFIKFLEFIFKGLINGLFRIFDKNECKKNRKYEKYLEWVNKPEEGTSKKVMTKEEFEADQELRKRME